MPELPEVETIVRDLRPLLVGRTITAVERDEEELRKPWKPEWEHDLIARKFKALNRRGKWILCEMTRKAILVFHMGMTGQLTVHPQTEERRDHTHLILSLRPGQCELRFRDTRRFGSATLYKNDTYLQSFFESIRLGPEPFELDPERFQTSLAQTTRCIKAVLLDQQTVAGLGNIYVDEILFEAQIHPSRISGDLTASEVKRIRESIPRVLTEAIEHRGSSIRNFIGGSGLQGGYQNEFLAYGRGGLPCSRCDSTMKQMQISGRTSCFCPVCQPVPRQTRIVKKSRK